MVGLQTLRGFASMSSLKDLLAQRAALDQQISETKERERADAIAKVRSLMADLV